MSKWQPFLNWLSVQSLGFISIKYVSWQFGGRDMLSSRTRVRLKHQLGENLVVSWVLHQVLEVPSRGEVEPLGDGGEVCRLRDHGRIDASIGMSRGESFRLSRGGDGCH